MTLRALRAAALGAAAALLLVSPALAQEAGTLDYLDELPPLLDRELFFGNPEITGGQLSPDGRHVSFLKELDGVLNVWVKGIDEPFDAARPVTADTARPVFAYFWSADGENILYLQDKGGNENYHVHVVDPDAAPAEGANVPPSRDLTPIEGVQARVIDVPEDDPAHILVALNDRDPQLHDVHRVAIATGERTLVQENDRNVAGWMTDLEGDLRLGVRIDEIGNTNVLRVAGDSVTTIYTCDNEETCNPIRFHEDGRRVYMETNKGEPDLTRLVLLDVATGETEPVESDPEGEVDFGSALFSEATDELVATSYEGDRIRWYPKSEDFARDLERARAELPDGDYGFRSMTEDGRYWLVSVSRDVEPSSTYLYDRPAGTFDLLYRVRPEIDPAQMAEMRPVRYTARDGVEVPGYLTIPRGVEAEGLATVVFPHGGPWARDEWGFDNFAQFLANRGYAVLQPNFRGSAGYGERFLNLGNEQWGTGTMQHDITDGVRWLVEEGIADPDEVAIMGGSYGGYATLAGLAFTPELYAAGVDIVGPSNIVTLLNSIPPYWAPIKAIFDVRVGDPEDPEDRARLEAQSPLGAVDSIRAPLLVIQGANDPRVKKRESDQMVVALREKGLPVEYMVAADEGHGFANEDNTLAMTAKIEEFLARHLGGRYQAEVPPEIEARLATMMVDVDTLSMPELATGGEAGETIAAFEGADVESTTLTYVQTIETRGQTMEVEAGRTIAETTWDGRPALVVVDRAETPQGAAIDSTFVDPATLVPLRRSIRQGPATIEIVFDDGRVTGSIEAGPRTMPIDVSADGPVFVDGGALEVALATLGLEEGASASLQVFQPLRGEVETVRVEAGGTETVETPAGSFEATRYTLSTVDGEGGKTVWVADDRVVKVVHDLPPQMGGGTATAVLAGPAD